jgi:phosphopantothenoylcysteine decarboxylase/phosphopantothenate--cysteine ligase
MEADRKKIVLGVSASIAAYKSADLASKLVQLGVDVYPVLTRDATRIIQPAAFRALTGNPCPVGVFDEPFPGEIAHIKLATLADLFVIAPASMNLMARLAAGLADDMLSAAALATSAPILLAPAMNTGMWNNPATRRNVETLRGFGYAFVDPVSGRLACRTEGQGKMADVQTIVAAIVERLGLTTAANPNDCAPHAGGSRGVADWSGLRVLVTAGPTREPIDPVRFITNRSSGKMGYAVAEAAARRGADVTLISGPTALDPPAGIDFVPVETASQMRDAASARFPECDLLVAAAAVSDYRPAHTHPFKIKKAPGDWDLSLEPTTDILEELGRRKRPGQMLVGFAAETDDILGNARKKLFAKNLDWIAANDITADGAGFDSDTNIVTLLGAHGEEISLPKLSKRETAERILDLVILGAHPKKADGRA